MRVYGRFRRCRLMELLGVAVCVLPLLSRPLPAHAASTPSPEGGREIQASIEAYFGKAMFERGALVIAPHGDGYDLVFYPGKAVAQPPSSQSPDESLTFHVTPRDDGRFAFRSERMNTPDLGASAGPNPFENCEAHGVFDAGTRFFASLSAGCDRIALKGRGVDASFEFGTGKVSLELTSTPTANGASDIRLALDAPGITASLPDKISSGPKQAGRISIGHLHYEIALNALRHGALLDLYRLASSLDPLDERKPSVPALRGGLKAVLPVWDTAQMASTVDDLDFESPGVTLRIGHYGDKQDLSGATTQGHYSMAMKLDGLSARLAGDPKVVDAILPSTLGARIALTGANFEQIANAMLGDPVSLEAGFESAMVDVLIDGKAGLSADVDVAAREYAVNGKAQAPVSLLMQGKGVFSAWGYDAIVTAVSKLKSDNVAGYALILAFLKGLARGTPDGHLSWDVALDLLARQITVNGQVFNLPEKGKE